MILLPPHIYKESLNSPNGGIEILTGHTKDRDSNTTSSDDEGLLGNDNDVRYLDPLEVAKHDKKGDVWMIIHGKVYDITSIIDTHPGGVEVLYDCAGIDATESFDDVSHSEYAHDMLKPYFLGFVKPSKPEIIKNSTIRRKSGGGEVKLKKKRLKKILPIDITNNNEMEEITNTKKKKPSNYFEFKREKERLRSINEQKKLHQEFMMKIYILSCFALALIGLILFIYLQRRKWVNWIDWNTES